MGIKSMFGWLNPVNDMKKIFKSGRDKDTEEYLNSYRDEKVTQIKNLAKNREYVASMPYETMLQKWGIEEHQVSMVVSGMRKEIISVGIVFAVVCFSAYLNPSLFYTVTTLSFLAVFATVAYTRIWRISCLVNKTFTPISKWWLSGCNHGD